MHTEMWEQPSVQENLATLRRRGVLVLEPETGPSPVATRGRDGCPSRQTIAELVDASRRGISRTAHRTPVLMSAGGTREAIDPVRVISNRSSGRQGYALAEVACRMGATVTLVTTIERELALDARRAIEVVRVESAEEMHDAMMERTDESDCVIMAAAVADFTIKASPEKLKRRDGLPELHVEPAVDVLADLVARRHAGQVIVGFAAETPTLKRTLARSSSKRTSICLVVNDVCRTRAWASSTTPMRCC